MIVLKNDNKNTKKNTKNDEKKIKGDEKNAVKKTIKTKKLYRQ